MAVGSHGAVDGVLYLSIVGWTVYVAAVYPMVTAEVHLAGWLDAISSF